MRHIVSATALTSGEQLAMCGHVFPSYRAAVDAGHAVGNYTPTMTTLAAYHARGIDCEACAVRHSQSNGHIGIAEEGLSHRPGCDCHPDDTFCAG